MYTSSWAGTSVSLDNFFIGNITGSPYGIHIYRVDDVPSQTDGLETVSPRSPYYGVFSADAGVGNTFDLSDDCKFFRRTDNSESPWVESTSHNGIVDRAEILPPVTKDVHIPNVITPNDDGRNDRFVITRGADTDVNLKIFSRWGKKVYASEGYKNEWDAEGVAGGVYYYILSTPCINEKRGTLRVIK